jgi:hypothetical protein
MINQTKLTIAKGHSQESPLARITIEGGNEKRTNKVSTSDLFVQRIFVTRMRRQ